MAINPYQQDLAEISTQENLYPGVERFFKNLAEETRLAYEEGKEGALEGLRGVPGGLLKPGGPVPELGQAAAGALGMALSPAYGVTRSVARTPVEQQWGPVAEKLGVVAGFLPEVAALGKLPLTLAAKGSAGVEKGLRALKGTLKGPKKPPFVPGGLQIKGPYHKPPRPQEHIRMEDELAGLPPKVRTVEGASPEVPPTAGGEYPGEKELYASLRGLPRYLRESFTGKGAKPLELHRSPMAPPGEAWAISGELFDPTHPETAKILRRNPLADVIATGPELPGAALYDKIVSALRHEGIHALLTPGRIPEPVRGKLLEAAMDVSSKFTEPAGVSGYVRGVWGKPIFKHYRETGQAPGAHPDWPMLRAEQKYTEGLAQAIAPGRGHYAPDIPLEARTSAIEALRMANKRLKAHKRLTARGVREQ